MYTEIYSLERDDLSIIADRIPDFVADRTGAPGYFTIGAGQGILGDDRLKAVCQFYVGAFQNGACFGRLDYIYVSEDARRKGIGRKLIDRMDTILKNSGISTAVLLFPKAGNKLPGFDIDREEALSFFESSGFFLTKDEEAVYFSDIENLSKNLQGKGEESGSSELSGLSEKQFSGLLSIIGKEAPLPRDLSRKMDSYDPNMSFFYKEKDRGGILLATRYGYSMARIRLLRSFGKRAVDGLFDLIEKALFEFRDRMDDGFLVVLDGSAIAEEKSYKSIFPDMTRILLSSYVRFTTE